MASYGAIAVIVTQVLRNDRVCPSRGAENLRTGPGVPNVKDASMANGISRPLSPHLQIYRPQITSLSPADHVGPVDHPPRDGRRTQRRHAAAGVVASGRGQWSRGLLPRIRLR